MEYEILCLFIRDEKIPSFMKRHYSSWRDESLKSDVTLYEKIGLFMRNASSIKGATPLCTVKNTNS